MGWVFFLGGGGRGKGKQMQLVNFDSGNWSTKAPYLGQLLSFPRQTSDSAFWFVVTAGWRNITLSIAPLGFAAIAGRPRDSIYPSGILRAAEQVQALATNVLGGWRRGRMDEKCSGPMARPRANQKCRTRQTSQLQIWSASQRTRTVIRRIRTQKLKGKGRKEGNGLFQNPPARIPDIAGRAHMSAFLY